MKNEHNKFQEVSSELLDAQSPLYKSAWQLQCAFLRNYFRLIPLCLRIYCLLQEMKDATADTLVTTSGMDAIEQEIKVTVLRSRITGFTRCSPKRIFGTL